MKNERSYKRGDFPGLDSGPVSAEHERRFLTNGTVAEDRADKTGASAMMGVQNTQNHAKEEARPS